MKSSHAEPSYTTALADTEILTRGEDPTGRDPKVFIARDDTLVLPEGSHVGRFVILDGLGAGGFSVVYRAFDPRLERVVAIKLMRSDTGGIAADESRRERLAREAQALAKVTHPNVVAVHDVGTHEDEVFIAMELVEGLTIKEWVAAARPSVREIVRVFADACSGLAAAHRAGLVHRDIKPSNIIVGQNGRVKLVDFGLARATHEPEEARDDSSQTDLRQLSIEITRSGITLGTPAYMSPEQHRGGRATPFSDQFSLCVSLFEVLCGQRPFDGVDSQEIRRAVLSDQRATPARWHKLPRSLRRILVRGMARRPRNRFATTCELHAALQAFLDRRRRRQAVLAGSLGLICAAGAWGFAAQRSVAGAQLCAGSEERFAEIWNEAAAAGVSQRFAATGKRHAAATFARVDSLVTQYGQAWSAQRTQTCRATRVFGEQSEALLDQRVSCLDRKLEQLDELTHLFEGAGAASVIDEAVAAVRGLTAGLRDCTELAPALADDGAWRLEREELDRAEVLVHAGRYADAQRIAAAVVERAGGAPATLRAHGLELLGRAQVKTGAFDRARTTLEAALHAAAEAKDVDAQARLWTDLISLVGDTRADFAAAEAMILPAELVLEMSGSQRLRAHWLGALGHVMRGKHELDRAETYLRQGLAIIEALPAAAPLDEARVVEGLGQVALRRNRLSEAQGYFERERALLLEELGPEHPRLSGTLNNLAAVFAERGNYREAVGAYEQIIAMATTTGASDSLALAKARFNLSLSVAKLKDFARAEAEMAKALELLRAQLGIAHPHVMSARIVLAEVALETGEAARAEASLRQVLGDLDPAPSLNRAFTQHTLGRALNAQHRYRDAEEAFMAATADAATTLGQEHQRVGMLLVARGQNAFDAGWSEAAIAHLERAQRILAASSNPPEVVAEAQFGLARALWQQAETRPRAVSLARESLALYERASTATNEERGVVQRWLASR